MLSANYRISRRQQQADGRFGLVAQPAQVRIGNRIAAVAALFGDNEAYPTGI